MTIKDVFEMTDVTKAMEILGAEAETDFLMENGIVTREEMISHLQSTAADGEFDSLKILMEDVSNFQQSYYFCDGCGNYRDLTMEDIRDVADQLITDGTLMDN